MIYDVTTRVCPEISTSAKKVEKHIICRRGLYYKSSTIVSDVVMNDKNSTYKYYCALINNTNIILVKKDII